MARIDVDLSRMHAESQTIKTLQVELGGVSDRVTRLANNNGLSGTSYLAIRSRLRQVSSAVSAEKEKMGGMSDKLSSIAALYQKNECDLAGNAFEKKGSGSDSTGGSPWGMTEAGYSQSSGTSNESETILQKLLHGGLSGALISGGLSTTGSVLGVNAAGSLTGELLGGSIKTKRKAEWDLKKGEAGITGEISAEGHLAKGTASGNIGWFKGVVNATVGSVGATGKVGATLFKDGKISPAVVAKAEAKASAVKGDATVSFGNDDYNAHAKAEGSLATARAEAGIEAGKITYKDKTTGQSKTEYGIKASAGAEAYLAEGKVSGGFTICGIKIDAGLSGKAGGAGVKASGQITTGGVSGEIGAGLGLGAGIKISIDWTGFKWPWE